MDLEVKPLVTRLKRSRCFSRMSAVPSKLQPVGGVLRMVPGGAKGLGDGGGVAGGVLAGAGAGAGADAGPAAAVKVPPREMMFALAMVRSKGFRKSPFSNIGCLTIA
jgi:hypothetical protein